MDRVRGSITVYLSLVGMIILAMLGTCVETARYTTCAGSGAELLRTGTHALLTEYSRPVYDHYGLFFLESTGKPHEKVIAEYVADGLEKKYGFTDFLGGEMTELEIKKKTYAGDDGAAPLMKEITAYMERNVTGDMLSKFLKKTSKFADTEQNAKQIEETVDEEREDKKLDERIVRLMRLVDGVRLTGSGKVSVSDYFVKKFSVSKEFDGKDFGVFEGIVWTKMKRHINKTPVKWKIDARFKTILSKVIEKTEAAVDEGKRLKNDYASSKHSELAARVVAGLPSLDTNLRVLKETKELIGRMSEGKELKKKLKKLWKDYDTKSLSFDYSGVGAAGGDDSSPLDALGSAVGSGILALTCENPDKVSDKGVKKTDRYAKYYKSETGKVEDYSDRMEKLARDEEVELGGALGSVGSYALNEFMLDSYITKTFPSYTVKDNDKKWKRALDYGWEYVVAGEKSDRDNLESVLSRILLIRTVINCVAIMTDGSKRSQALAAATAIVGMIGLVFLIKFVQTLILIVWALVESLTDVAALLLGKDVPVIKKSTQIKTTFPEVFLINNSSIISRAKRYGESKKSSFGYKEYVCLFMMMTDAKIRSYRVMDLIENDMKKNGYKSFSFGDCVFDMRVKAGFSYPAKLFGLPALTRFLGRDISRYDYGVSIRAGYL